VINLDAAATPQQLRELTAQLRGQPRSLIDALIGAIKPTRRPKTRALDEALWGPAPSDAEVRRAAAENLAMGVARRDAVLESSLTRAEVAERLGKTAQAVSAMLERGALLGLKAGREWRIPPWQLDPGLSDGVLPGIAQLADAYRDGIVSLTEWTQRPNADLDDATPRDALARGRVDEVVAAARSE
jgi:hypothetical protein